MTRQQRERHVLARPSPSCFVVLEEKKGKPGPEVVSVSWSVQSPSQRHVVMTFLQPSCILFSIHFARTDRPATHPLLLWRHGRSGSGKLLCAIFNQVS